VDSSIKPQPAVESLKRVLVVEDEATTYKAMRVLLTHYGFEVVHSPTLADALSKLAKNWEYVFIDLTLPDGDGSKVLELIRSRRMQTKVAVITGTEDAIRLSRVQSLKPDAIFQKPLNILSLLEKLQVTK
jgi:two-component system cell cycle response regulator CtrA